MNAPAAPTLLYLPNEVEEGDQVGPRLAFRQMVEGGKLAKCEVLSFLVLARQQGEAGALAAIQAKVAECRPDVLIWQHIGAFPVDAAFFQNLRRLSPRTRIVYHEGDMFGRGKPLPAATRQTMAAADLVAVVSTGRFAAEAKQLCSNGRVAYCPPAYDPLRFDQPWAAPQEREFDVVLIGNRVRSRLPWRTMPGARERERLVQQLGRSFGARFAVFGHGWSGSQHQGSVAYAEQERTLRRAWISVSWDHFDKEAGYHSDRIPIALISGVAHVTNWQPDYDKLFGAETPLLWESSAEAMVARCQSLLAEGPEALTARGVAGQQFARTRFAPQRVYSDLMATALELKARGE